MGCDWFGAQKPKKEVMKVTLGVETSLLPAAVWVSEFNGYFEDATPSILKVEKNE